MTTGNHIVDIHDRNNEGIEWLEIGDSFKHIPTGVRWKLVENNGHSLTLRNADEDEQEVDLKTFEREYLQ